MTGVVLAFVNGLVQALGIVLGLAQNQASPFTPQGVCTWSIQGDGRERPSTVCQATLKEL